LIGQKHTSKKDKQKLQEDKNKFLREAQLLFKQQFGIAFMQKA